MKKAKKFTQKKTDFMWSARYFSIIQLSNSNVAGDKKNIRKIVDSVKDIIYTVKEIFNGLTADKFPLSEKNFCEMKM